MGNCIDWCVLNSRPNPNLNLFKYKSCWVYIPKDQIYDGDTCKGIIFHRCKQIKLNFRLFGYDSPEMKPSRNLNDREKIKKKALNAKNFLADQIGDQVVWAQIRGFDKYGRVLADFYKKNFSQSIHINSLMIEKKHGVPYFGGKKSTNTV